MTFPNKRFKEALAKIVESGASECQIEPRVGLWPLDGRGRDFSKLRATVFGKPADVDRYANR